MSDKQSESLSALMDNEANELELHRLLSQSHDPELRARWSRYHIARSALRNDVSSFTHIDISAAVSQAVDNETLSGKKSWVKAIGSMAVAASVTLAILVGVRVYNTQLSDTADMMAAAQDRPAVQGVELPAMTLQQGETYASFGTEQIRQDVTSNQPVVRVVRRHSPYAQSRLQDFMNQHAEQATLNANLGVIPYARVNDDRAQ
ncbi:MAG TPA: RseA family anti-sigma factor [Pseudomonadales bacterium]|nr:RseA family anti-sigma factor [Pseudomonadales bacterium]